MSMSKTPFNFLDHATKRIFTFFWSFLRKVNPTISCRLLYWGISDKVLQTPPYVDSILNVNVLGKTFPNPIGIAAGFDKKIKYTDELIRSGFAFGELGTFTYKPDDGSQKKIFISDRKAILTESNSFPNKGIVNIGNKLLIRRHLPHIVGVNISSSIGTEEQDTPKFLEDLSQDLIKSIQHVAPYCDFITLNLSHPKMAISILLNNPVQLRELIRLLKQQIQKFAPILTPKLLLKLPCSDQMNVALLSEIFSDEAVDGLIIGGFSTLSSIKQDLSDSHTTGYLSGSPIKALSTKLLQQFHTETQGKIPLIACGGVFNGQDAFEKITSGASLIQLHSAILYEGVEIANKINRELSQILRRTGIRSLEEIIGKKI